jgi:hypothetical protein
MTTKKHSPGLGDIFREVGKKISKPGPERETKGRKSFSIDKYVIDDLETLAWYMEKSSSEVVEEAIKIYIENNNKLLEKGKEIKASKHRPS